MKTIVSFLTIVFIGVSYFVQNSIINQVSRMFAEQSPTPVQTVGIFATLAIIGALIPFLLYMWTVLALIRRQDR